MDKLTIKEKIGEAVKLINNRSYKEALECLKDIVSENKNDPKILNLYGIVQLQLNKINEAINSFERTILLDKKFIQGYNNLGNVYVKSGKLRKAVEMYNKVLSLKPDYPAGFNNLASAQSDLGELEDSIKNYENALKHDPNHVSAKNNIIQVLTFYSPKNTSENVFTKSNSELQQIEIPYKESSEISDEDVILFYKKCKEIVDRNFKDFDFHLSQIWRSNTINLGCNRHFEIFNKFKVIPEYCFGCFKVQIELKSIIDLIKLYFIFDKLNLSKNNSRKCMIELRENATGTYKGLIYCSGIDEANLICEQLSRIIDEKIKREIKVGVKRGCTEFGIEHPEYKIIDKDSKDFMIYNNEWKEKENIIDSNTLKYARENSVNRKPTISGVTLNDILIMKNWIYYAKKIGDGDYKKLDENIFASSHIENQTSKKLKYVKKGTSYNLS
jgi:tetratricopeptide (TPR) repeat protein